MKNLIFLLLFVSIALIVFIKCKKISFMEIEQIIPKQIFVTFSPEYEELPQIIKDNIENTKLKNTDYTVNYYSDTDAEKFIYENFPEYIGDYKTLVPGAYKADLLRLLLLYKYGGVYNDIGHVYLEPVNKFISSNEKLVVCKDSGLPNLPPYLLHNAIIASIPKHDMIKKAIDVVIENIRNRFYGNSGLEPTGPGALGKAFNIHFGRKEDEEIQVGMFEQDIKVMNYIENTIKDIDGSDKIKTKFDNYYETVYPNGKERYGVLWDKRNIYSTP
jgi:mannosyltransferase OCH1-like enzyme